MPVEHVIFDCDGVLVDSEHLTAIAEARLFAEIGVEVTPEMLHQRFVGRTSREIWTEMTAEQGKPLPANFLGWYEDRMELLYRHELQPVAGIVPALARLAVGASCASNSTRRMLELKIDILGARAVFGTRLHSADDVDRPKPHPDMYLKAAAAAGVAPAHCVVIEDTPTGARAGVAAGMRVLGFVGAHRHPADVTTQLLATGVTAVFEHMDQLNDQIERLG